ncbi:MAG: AAA family ATPase [Oligoflexia bacterium]|nr:AAA family ATPase [Oligoflexia bacterium]
MKPNLHFIGRNTELAKLAKIGKQKEASIIVIYGRRRIGKTELIEQYFKKKKVLKFEGIQPDHLRPRSKNEERLFQLQQCLHRLSRYVENPLLEKLTLSTWSEFFELLVPILAKGELVLYFEEVQWLSNYQSEFLAAMKPFWDDYFRHNPKLKVVLCGSASSSTALR